MKIGVANFSGTIFGVGDVMTHVSFFATEITFFCHMGDYNPRKGNCEPQLW